MVNSNNNAKIYLVKEDETINRANEGQEIEYVDFMVNKELIFIKEIELYLAERQPYDSINEMYVEKITEELENKDDDNPIIKHLKKEEMANYGYIIEYNRKITDKMHELKEYYKSKVSSLEDRLRDIERFSKNKDLHNNTLLQFYIYEKKLNFLKSKIFMFDEKRIMDNIIVNKKNEFYKALKGLTSMGKNKFLLNIYKMIVVVKKYIL